MRLHLSLDSENIVPPKKIAQQDECGILIVEDEKIWRQIYKINLFKNKSKRKYKFYEASNGREALTLIAQHSSSIKIILLDLVMPTMEGPEFIDFLFTKWGLSHIGIFVLTAYGNEETMQESQLLGVRAFIDKQNIDFEQVSLLIDKFLDFAEKPKGISTGFYLENRPSSTGDPNDIHLRWNLNLEEEKAEGFRLGTIQEIQSVDLPNLRTDFDIDPIQEP